jgi:hypothetical protein
MQLAILNEFGFDYTETPVSKKHLQQGKWFSVVF